MSLITPAPLDARLILSDEALDGALELSLLAEAALWMAADAGLEGEPARLGRGHFRAAFLMKRHPGLGAQDLSRMTGLSKQGASKVLKELTDAGYAATREDDADARRKPLALTAAGLAFEARVSQKLRAALAKAYRTSGLDKAAAARAVWSALAGPGLRDTGRRP